MTADVTALDNARRQLGFSHYDLWVRYISVGGNHDPEGGPRLTQRATHVQRHRPRPPRHRPERSLRSTPATAAHSHTANPEPSRASRDGYRTAPATRAAISLRVTTSVGLAASDDPTVTSKQLLATADAAMYRHKF